MLYQFALHSANLLKTKKKRGISYAAFAALQNNITLNDFVKDAINYAVRHKDEILKETA